MMMSVVVEMSFKVDDSTVKLMRGDYSSFLLSEFNDSKSASKTSMPASSTKHATERERSNKTRNFGRLSSTLGSDFDLPFRQNANQTRRTIFNSSTGLQHSVIDASSPEKALKAKSRSGWNLSMMVRSAFQFLMQFFHSALSRSVPALRG